MRVNSFSPWGGYISLEAEEQTVVGGIMAPPKVQNLILTSCDYVTSHSNTDFADVITFQEPELMLDYQGGSGLIKKHP